MSDVKNISPLLDGFTLGAPISEHHGVVCRPAIKENSAKKYIVKSISVPASQVQFDAMLLSGAYKDPGDAMEYFRNYGEEILQEANLLKTLSKLEGFLSYDGWQMEPIARRRLGYEVYLVGSYKRSLEKYIRKKAVTHLEAINLALDLCAALTVCRQSGFIYADLKPSNIYVSEKKEYRIGDLGFLPLNALHYTSFPERYFSPYTPPELMDPMAPMNLTVDTYPVGMILYQLYNDGHLPFSGLTPVGELPTPCQADYEMAEIIMKAIHADPSERWTDPKELGKAIAAYMQRNSINDTPITQFASLEIPADEKVEAVQVIAVDSPEAGEVMSKETAPEETSQISVSDTDTVPEDAGMELNSSDCMNQLPTEDDAEPQTLEALENTVISDSPEEPEEEPGSQTVIDAVSLPTQSDEPNEIASLEASLQEISEDVARIISKADDIIAHEIPQETCFPAEPEDPDPFAFVKEDSEEIPDEFPADLSPEPDLQPDPAIQKKKTKHFEDPGPKRFLKKIFSVCFTISLLVVLCAAGLWYYQNLYLQTIDAMIIQGTQDQLTVLVDTRVEESQLTVTCTDSKGQQKSKALQGGKVLFSGLTPSTQYTIELDMKGFHKLVGKTSDVFTTNAPTQILSFLASAGSEDGSVQLNFTVDGEDPDFWNIRYTAEGEEELLETVTGHSAMITGLTIGKVYTFTLDGGKNFDLSGETTAEYLAARLILAENLRVVSSTGTDITVHWDTPGDVVVDRWNIRFYDGYGFEEQVSVTENHVLFTGIDPTTEYTMEITAAGMIQPSRIIISSDPINLSAFEMDESAKTKMKVTWDYTGNDPEDGWILLYTVDGSGSQVVQCEKALAEISPLIPGASYDFTLQSADGRTVFNNTIRYQAKPAEVFTEHNFKTENLSIDLLKTPEDTEWHFETVSPDSFTDSFVAGESVSMVLQNSETFYMPGNKTTVLFVFRDSYGNVLPEFVSEVSCPWKSIWDTGDKKIGEIDIPQVPTTAGNYVLELYFNGRFVAKTALSVIQ